MSQRSTYSSPRQPAPRDDRLRTLTREVDEYRRACGKLREANDKLTRSNQELTQFAYVASHDLQEPLRMVDSYLGLIERRYKGRLDSSADEFIGFAMDGARRMKRLIDDLLSYSRVSNCALQIAHVDTGQVLGAVLATLAGPIGEAGAAVKIGRLPMLEADPVQLERLFINLIGNALKFRGERALRITISARQSGGAWEFSVADNGIGIEPEFHEKVFEIFARLHPRGQYEGSGIGLSACKRIVELHGGSIAAASVPGGGTAMRFTLPERYPEEEPAT